MNLHAYKSLRTYVFVHACVGLPVLVCLDMLVSVLVFVCVCVGMFVSVLVCATGVLTIIKYLVK